jgi:DNA-binding MarR family transcriptional regulator
LYEQVLKKQLSNIGLDNHGDILLVISEENYPLSQNQLAQIVQIDKYRMVNIVAKLSQKGLININKNPLDRREHYVYLTSKAEKIIPELRNMTDRTLRLLQEGIPQKDLNTCFEVLRTINSNLLSATTKKPPIKCS